MRHIIIALIAALAVMSAASAAQRNNFEIHLPDGTTVIMSSSKEIPVGTTMFVLKGDARLKVFNKAEGTAMTAKAETITAVLFASQEEQKAAGAENRVKSVDLVGSPELTYTGPKALVDEKTGKKLGQVTVTTEAKADSATYSGIEGIAYLVGNVKITRDDPSAFNGVATGDKASINLRHAPGSGDFDFKIESDPSTSQIEVVPKAK